MTAIFYTSNVSIQLLLLPADLQNVTTGYIYKLIRTYYIDYLKSRLFWKVSLKII